MLGSKRMRSVKSSKSGDSAVGRGRGVCVCVCVCARACVCVCVVPRAACVVKKGECVVRTESLSQHQP